MQREEHTILPAAPELIGRKEELADLHRWLEDKETRVIAMSGPNSVGKTRLCIEATRRFAPITLFVKDAAAVRQAGLAVLADPRRPVIIVAEDPPLELVEPLAKQAVSALYPLKLIITIPSPATAPVVKLNPDERVKETSIKAVPRHVAEEIIKAVNSDMDNNVRGWIIQQAGGIPGVLVAAADMGNELRLKAGSLRDQLLRRFCQRLLSRADREALHIVQVLSPFVYVDTTDSSPELQTLLAAVGLTMTVAGVRRRLADLEKLGYVRRRGNFIAVTPPLFAAGLFQELIDADPGLPIRLFNEAEFSVRVRLLERLVMLGLPESNPFWAHVFGGGGPFGEPQLFASNFGLLDYLARAVPNRVARFLHQEWDFVWTDVLPNTRGGATQLAEALLELLDEPTTAATSFSIVVELAKREATAGTETTFCRIFEECFVYWYFRVIPYALKNQAIDALTNSTNSTHRQLAIKAMISATNPPTTLGGRSVRAQRLHSQPNYGSWREVHDFLIGMMRRRLACCASGELELRTLALVDITHAITKLSECLPGVEAMIVIRETAQAYFDGQLPVDVTDFYEHVRWVRNRYEQNSNKPEQSECAQDWRDTVAELDALLIRLVGGVFEHRLKIALVHSSNFEEVEVEGRKLYGYQAEILKLAREVCANTVFMDDNAWTVLDTKGAIHAGDFVFHLGEEDKQQRHFSAMLTRAVDWRTSYRLGYYLRGNPKHADRWLKMILGDLNVSTPPTFPLVPALWAIGPTPTARECLRVLLKEKLVKPTEVALAFSSGRWLDDLPVTEVLAVLEFIVSEPEQEGNLLGVVALYLHHQKPLPRELFPVIRSALIATFNSGTRDDYNYNQAAAGLARTDLEEGLRIFTETTAYLSGQAHDFWHSGWNPLGGYGSHDFWDYLRETAPERAYQLLGGLRSLVRLRITRGSGERCPLDLAKRRSVLLSIAREDEASACVFAACLLPTTLEFYPFAAELIEQHPSSTALRSALNETLLPHGGFGTMYDQFSAVGASVQSELGNCNLSLPVRNWLQGLLEFIERRKQEELPRHMSLSEPNFLE